MNRTPQQLLEYFRNNTCYDVKLRSNGRKSIFKNGKMIINHLTSKHPGYLNMKEFKIKNLDIEERSQINNSGTMSINTIDFNRLQELINIL